MIQVVRRTGHSSYYVEKGMGAMGRTPKQMGIQGEYRICGGGKRLSLHYMRLGCQLVDLRNSIPSLAGGDSWLCLS